MPSLAPAALLDDLRRNAFSLPRPPAAPPRLGMEVELIPVCAETGAQLPIRAEEGPCTLPLLRGFGAAHGWRELRTPYGAPAWKVPGAGVVSYEPGGQVELSADPRHSAGALLAGVRGTLAPLTVYLGDRGVRLLSVGVEPAGRLDAVALQLPGGRYRRLDAFLASIGTGGARMMRQTAAVQVSVDWGAEPLLAWRVLNAMAPYLVATFASSPFYAGEDTGHRSGRAAIWRALDGGRTGIFPCEAPVEEYLRFALEAPAILLPAEGEPEEFRPFAAWLAEGAADEEAWAAHLTTLFPEVRPRGFAEVRAPDAVAPEWYAAPLVLAALVHHPPALRAAAELLGRPDPALLVRAGRDGLSHPALARTAEALASLALDAARAVPCLLPPAVAEEAAAYFERFTFRGRAPADDLLDARVPLAVGAAAPAAQRGA